MVFIAPSFLEKLIGHLGGDHLVVIHVDLGEDIQLLQTGQLRDLKLRVGGNEPKEAFPHFSPSAGQLMQAWKERSALQGLRSRRWAGNERQSAQPSDA